MCEITVDAIQENLREAVSVNQQATKIRLERIRNEGQIVSRREHWINWAGKVYGPYRDAAHALQDGFHLPKEGEQQ